MRTAIISDVHGNDIAFEAVEKDMKSKGANNVIFLGDLIAIGPQPEEVYDRLMAMNKLCLVKGNTDAWLDHAMADVIPTTEKEIRLLNYYDYMTHRLSGEVMDRIIGFQHEATIHLGHFLALCVHGSPRMINEGIYEETEKYLLEEMLEDVKCTAVLSGHTHIKHDFTFNMFRLINPGTVGLCNAGNDPRASYMILDTTRGFHIEHHMVDYDRDKLIQLATDRKLPNMDDYRMRLTKSLV